MRPARLFQVLYPGLMITMICRTFRVRVRPDALIVFRPNAEEGGDSDEATGAETPGGGGSGSKKPGFFSRVCTGVKEDHSMFAWADTGGWETAETAEAASEETRLEADRFRAGFEPLFVDFSKRGSWFMVYCLLEVHCFLRFGGTLGVFSLISAVLKLPRVGAFSYRSTVLIVRSFAQAKHKGSPQESGSQVVVLQAALREHRMDCIRWNDDPDNTFFLAAFPC